jgi:hypothetical protein
LAFYIKAKKADEASWGVCYTNDTLRPAFFGKLATLFSLSFAIVFFKVDG